MMEQQKENIEQTAKELAKKLEPLIQQLNKIYDDAVVAYTPLVEDLCSRSYRKRSWVDARLAIDRKNTSPIV